jgi:hypothetical protein
VAKAAKETTTVSQVATAVETLSRRRAVASSRQSAPPKRMMTGRMAR